MSGAILFRLLMAAAAWFILAAGFLPPETTASPLRGEPQGSPSGWIIRRVGNNDQGTLPAMQLDGADLPHLAYYDPQGSRLVYARLLGDGKWQEETAVANMAEEDIVAPAEPPGMVLESGDRVHLAFLSGGRMGYVQGTCAADGCSWSEVDWVVEDATPCGSVALTLDPVARPHILICRGIELEDFYFDTSKWYHHLVDDSPVTKTAAVVTRASDHNLRAAYTMADGSLAYAWWNGSTWTHEFVKMDEAAVPALLWENDQNKPYLAYLKTDTLTLEVAKRSLTWDRTPVILEGGALASGIDTLSMQLAGQKVHLAFSETASGRLYYVYQDDEGQWLSAPPAAAGRLPVFRLDSRGWAWIAFVDASGRLALAVQGYPHYFPIMLR